MTKTDRTPSYAESGRSVDHKGQEKTRGSIQVAWDCHESIKIRL